MALILIVDDSPTEVHVMKKALEKLELVVISDPYPPHMAVMSDRKNDTSLLPTCTQFETSGSAVASNRSLQWREQVIEPLFESEPDQDILCRGVVTKKYSDSGNNFVELDIWTEKPDGKKTSPGTALVTLPSRN